MHAIAVAVKRRARAINLSLGSRLHVMGRLAASTGAWSGPVASLAIRWERCSRGGSSCRVVTRGRAIYHVVRADAGTALRIVVRAVGEDGRPVEAASHLLRIRR